MNEVTVTIRVDTCVLHLNLPVFLEQSNQAQLTKTLKMLFKHYHDHAINPVAVQVLDEYIPGMVDEKKHTWGQAGREYTDGYRDLTLHRYSRKEAAKIKANNNKLLESVKSAKRDYEKAKRTQNLYVTIRGKYNV